MNAPTKSVLTLKRNTPAEATAPALEERLHKVLANGGLGSRRMLEQRIQAGEVVVNGQPADLGSSVRAGDRVQIDGKQFVVATDQREESEVLVYHKPEGVVTTREDPEGRPTVFEQLPRLKGARWIAVGRLDINTTGLLLLTSDGELANALMHPSSGLEREYLCRVHGEVPDEVIEQLKKGVELDDGPAHFDDVAIISRGGSHSWFRVVIREGRNREVRRLWDSQGFLVSRLKRIRYGRVELPRALRRGACEALDADTAKSLRADAGLGESQPTLTLSPVVNQRRTSRHQTEYRPEQGRGQAWSGSSQDEARELRAFDRVRDEAPRGRGGRPGGRGSHGGGGRPGGREVNGNVLRPERGGKPGGRGGKRGVAPGQELPSVRTWFAGDAREGGGFGQANGNSTRSPGGRSPRGSFGNGAGPTGGAQRRGGGRGPQSGGNRGPQGAGARGPQGGRGPQAGGRGGQGGNRGPQGARGPQSGNRGPQGGNRGPRPGGNGGNRSGNR